MMMAAKVDIERCMTCRPISSAQTCAVEIWINENTAEGTCKQFRENFGLCEVTSFGWDLGVYSTAFIVTSDAKLR